jgi:thiol:disulfide interchange protein DsbD
LACLALGGTAARAQVQRPIRWRATATSVGGDALAAKLSATIPDGWYLYALDQPSGGPVPLTATLLNAGARLRGAIVAPEADRKADRNFNMISLVYSEAVVLRLIAEGIPDRDSLRVAVRFQACTDRYCLPARTDTLAAARAVAASGSADGPAISEGTPVPRDVPVPGALGTAEAASEPVVAAVSPPRGAANADLAAFIWMAVTTGLLALLTPCVLPMVPITVGFFTARRDQRRASAMRDAGLFALGIVVSFVALGFGVALLFGATGVVSLAANPWLNLFVAVLFLGFAAQLAGWWTVSLPSTLLGRLTAATAGKHGAPALLAMGATFSLTSFTCTAPFVGTLLVIAARGSWVWPLLGLAAYATVFALPFFALALFPSALGRLPRSGPWLHTLKGVLAFLELAAVVKFVSNAAMVWGWPVATRTHVLIAWAAILVALILWLSRDTVRAWRSESRVLGATRVLVIGGSLWILVVCVRGISGAPVGELESFLPPRDASAATGELAWRVNDLEASRAAARQAGRPILVDFTGYTCTNCRWMEANMFPRPAVQTALARYERARLYTDGDGAMYAAQQRMQERITGSVALPYYVILDETGSIQRSFLGMTRDEDEFLAFLQVARTNARRSGQ